MLRFALPGDPCGPGLSGKYDVTSGPLTQFRTSSLANIFQVRTAQCLDHLDVDVVEVTLRGVLGVAEGRDVVAPALG